MTQEELLQKIGELIKASVEGLRGEIQAAKKEILVRIGQDAEDMAEFFHETWKKMDKQDERIAALEEHTGLTKQN